MTGEPFAATDAGGPARLFELDNGRGLVARVTDYGATLVQLHVPGRGGEPADVVLGFDSVEGYQSAAVPYCGATVGRVANRTAHGALTVDGEEYELTRNEPPHHLHGGGLRSFDRVVWRLVRADERTVEFHHVSPAGEEGYPGQVEVSAVYHVTGDALTVTYRARTDEPTPLNMTNHAYLNLGGAGTGTILDHELEIRADQYTPVRDDLIPTGEYADVADTPLDFRGGGPVGAAMRELPRPTNAGGYDHNFVLRGGQGEKRLAATLRHPGSGRVLELSTNQPGLQFYSGNGLSSPVGKLGRTYDRHGALCLEPQYFPDALHHPRFPSTVVRPGEVYEHVSEYRFTSD
ncbi:aldose 1-epimerase [Haloactinospora alba]|uniref:Aldose 1-epimerase n=1 Tax=Haloactinospora alba TaxID=405555 RepID=A0A543NK50_9ACTN|nr:aldose epimerase family protein [Haloactinospora alba]TQN32243.1 aldose 1-epimerase [Haloactinospora alba]